MCDMIYATACKFQTAAPHHRARPPALLVFATAAFRVRFFFSFVPFFSLVLSSPLAAFVLARIDIARAVVLSLVFFCFASWGLLLSGLPFPASRLPSTLVSFPLALLVYRQFRFGCKRAPHSTHCTYHSGLSFYPAARCSRVPCVLPSEISLAYSTAWIPHTT